MAISYNANELPPIQRGISQQFPGNFPGIFPQFPIWASSIKNPNYKEHQILNNHLQAERSCEYCGQTEFETNHKLSAHDLTNRLFCSREHFMKFYEERRTEHLISTPCPLDQSEVHAMEQSQKELYGKNSKFSQLSPDEKRARIQSSERALFRLRSDIMAMRRALDIDANEAVAAQLEQARKFGPEITSHKKAVKLQGAVEKAIGSYYNSNMSDETICNLVSMVSGLRPQQVQDEINNLRAKSLIGTPHHSTPIQNQNQNQSEVK